MAFMSAVGKIGEDALQGGHGRSRYRGRVRRLLSTLLRAALIVGALAIVRAVLLDRAPRRELHRGEPVIGSLDTWPAVPRKPQDSTACVRA